MMRLGIAMIPRAGAVSEPVVEGIVEFAAAVESLEFSGVWVVDSLGRGRPTLDPLILLSTLCAATRRIELGTAVLQLPLRNPYELAHRVQSLNLLSNGRLRLGVGAGSTEADFTFVGTDFQQRFKTLASDLGIMRQVWHGEPVRGATLSPWPGTESGPPVLLGAWRSARSIRLAAQTCQGWISSGIHSTWADLESGARIYRAAGGSRMVVANVPADVRPEPEHTAMSGHAQISLICPPDVARDRLQRLEQLGVDDVLLVAPFGSMAHLETLRGLV